MKKNSATRIGIITSSLDNNKLSAPASCQLELIKALRHISSPEIEIFLIHFKKGFNTEIYSRFNEVTCKKGIVATTKCINNLQLDVVHMNNLTYKWLGFYFLNTRKVVTIHGDASFVLPRSYFSKRVMVEEYIIRLIGKLGLLKRIDTFVVVSESLKKNLIKYLHIPANKIQIVYNGVGEKISFQENAMHTVQKKWGICSPYLLNVNNFAPKKNIETLLVAFKAYKKNNKNLKLVLVGSGLRLELSKKISKMELEGDVVILDHIQHADLSYLYSAATLLVNPTLHETFGLPNLEAMACRCPVLTSYRYSIPEVVGRAACMVQDPTDARELCASMTQLLQNKSELNRMREQGILEAQKFSWNRAAHQLITVYTTEI